jgi:hypothetical protein
MRQLWSDQVVYTRQYIIAALAGRPVSEVLTKVLGNAVAPIATAPGVRELVPKFSEGDAAAIGLLSTMESIADAIVPYYGEDAGKELTRLLRRYVLTAVDLLSAARGGHISRFKTEDERLITHAGQIADFLSSLNERWDRETLFKSLERLLQLTKDEAVARVAGNYELELRTYDEIHEQAMAIADFLTNGIALNVPEVESADLGGAR